MDLLCNFFRGQSKRFKLSKYLNLELRSDLKNNKLQVYFILTCDCCNKRVGFKKKTWNKIVENETPITMAFWQDFGSTIFINNEVKVYTERLGRAYHLCFRNMKGNFIHVGPKVFKRMMGLSFIINNAYSSLNRQIQQTSESIKALLNSILVQCNQANFNINEFKGFIANLQKYLTDLHPSIDSYLMDASSESGNEYDTDSDISSFIIRSHR